MLKHELTQSYRDALAEGLEMSAASKEEIYALAYRLYENGKYDEAGQLFRLLTFADLTASKHWMGLGAAYQMLKEYEEAAAAYAAAALTDANNPYAPLHGAECLLELGKWEGALDALLNAEKLTTQIQKHKELLPRIVLLRDACINKKKEQ